MSSSFDMARNTIEHPEISLTCGFDFTVMSTCQQDSRIVLLASDFNRQHNRSKRHLFARNRFEYKALHWLDALDLSDWVLLKISFIPFRIEILIL